MVTLRPAGVRDHGIATWPGLTGLGPLVRRSVNAGSADTAHQDRAGVVAATTRPLIPATTMLTGSSTAATTGLQTATTRASTTAATVHGRNPKSPTPIAATGTSKAPRPR